MARATTADTGKGQPGPPPWTSRADVVRTLLRRWDRGDYLAALAREEPVVPVAVPLRGPTAREVADRFGDVQDWVQTWERQAEPVIRLEYGTVGGRVVGVNRVPVRAHIDDSRHLWRLLGVTSQVETVVSLLERVRDEYPQLDGWARSRPKDLLARATVIPRALAVVRWIAEHGAPGVYLRQIDVPGVDTKFVEQNRTLLADLLDVVLPADRIRTQAPRGDLASRYGLASRPAYMRLRRLDDAPLTLAGVPTGGGRAGFSELTVRADDVADLAVDCRRVVVVENEITYLALPPLEATVAVLGGGYGVAQLARVHWLHDRDVVYWGDLDTHGFAILDQVRGHFPHTRSLLMDRGTLESHEPHWGVEASQLNRVLMHLTEEEQKLYRDLVEGTYRPGVRLEQERIRFGWVRAALNRLS